MVAGDVRAYLGGMLIIALLPVLCLVAGLLLMALSTRPPLVELGRALIFWGVGLTMIAIGFHRTIRLG